MCSDIICEDSGQTFVQLENGDWEIILVTEGFIEGCPISLHNTKRVKYQS
jgi:hypothetical protein